MRGASGQKIRRSAGKTGRPTHVIHLFTTFRSKKLRALVNAFSQRNREAEKLENKRQRGSEQGC